MGTNGNALNVQWKCDAMLPAGVEFDSIYVNCEGYANPLDPYILENSCGLEYSLKITERGEAVIRETAQTVAKDDDSNSGDTIVWTIVIVLLILILVAYIAMHVVSDPFIGMMRVHRGSSGSYLNHPHQSRFVPVQQHIVNPIVYANPVQHVVHHHESIPITTNRKTPRTDVKIETNSDTTKLSTGFGSTTRR